MSAEPVFGRLEPPPEGFTAEDLDRIPDLPPRTELVDGSLVLVSPQKLFHMRVISLLEDNLRRLARREGTLRVRREMSVVLGHRQRPVPDLILVRAEADGEPTQTAYPAEAVLLAVEVVSPDSEVRDRERKPQLYAQAGIPHFWRVEDPSGKITVYVYEIDPATGSYSVTGIFHDRLVLSVPLDIDIDLTEIDQY
ncbi:MAG: hypothetical protein V7603_3825 [Micromonosporaceae bacterium]